MTLGVVLAAGMMALIRQWSASGRRWSDLHSLALAFGALLVSMLWGFFLVTASNMLTSWARVPPALWQWCFLCSLPGGCENGIMSQPNRQEN